jgi:hypothetical protein
MARHGSRITALAAGIVALLAAAPARATFHEWQIEQIFSNADGTIQYVEFKTGAPGQNFLTGHVLDSDQGATVLDAFTFPSDLDHLVSTAGRSFLAATPAFAAAAGIQPDYDQLPAGFIHIGTTDTILIVGSITTPFTFAPPALPTDGVHALDASAGFPAVVADNTPTNFAGETGHIVPEPDASALAAAALGALALLARRRARREAAR